MSTNNIINLDTKFTRALNELKQANGKGLLDLNKRWENTACKILNVAYGLDLQRMENIKKNYPAIDLGDGSRMIGVQVSSRNDTPKINDMLTKLSNKVDGVPVSALYNDVYHFIIGYRREYYDATKFKIPDNVTFDESHILDFNSFKEVFERLDDTRQKEVLEILETDIVKRPTYQLNSELINFCDFVSNSRTAQMEQIDEAFKKSKNVFLWGLGGIGKTELAVKWAKEKIEQGEDVYLVHYRDSIIDTVSNLPFSNNKVNENEEDANTIGNTYAKNDADRRVKQFHKKLDIIREEYSNAIIIIDNFDKESPNVSWADMQNQKGYKELIGLKTRFLFTTRFEVNTSAV